MLGLGSARGVGNMRLTGGLSSSLTPSCWSLSACWSAIIYRTRAIIYRTRAIIHRTCV